MREEVSAQSHDWGFKVGSVYIRKVHFRDAGMIRQIEEKVMNRLRQVTSAIKQDGVEPGQHDHAQPPSARPRSSSRAAAMRPQIVGKAR